MNVGGVEGVRQNMEEVEEHTFASVEGQKVEAFHQRHVEQPAPSLVSRYGCISDLPPVVFDRTTLQDVVALCLQGIRMCLAGYTAL